MSVCSRTTVRSRAGGSGRGHPRCRRFGEHLDTTSNFGARKPEPEVFERALAHHGVPAERAFFADDMPVNVEAARVLGIHAVLVEEHTDLRRAVRAFVAAQQRVATA